ncbi:hypothetical protein [Bacillus sp. FJAT-27245]|uniref:hypothetical protein n=1 Tax=Bacillus sp. FJAT-27245 TaxID=1684144 RepID=UPI0006A7ACC3|nr:hypothetical protein [Bacillus sp. FJAT-27245]
MTILLFIYTGAAYLDYITQAVVITDFEKLENPDSSISDSDLRDLEQLGFSKTAISHMDNTERAAFLGIDGKIVSEKDIYRKIDARRIDVLSKKEYESMLKSYSTSYMPKFSSLERISLKLLHEGDRNFTLITEHHFDYVSGPIKPMGIEIQIAPETPALEKYAKQVWWTASTVGSEKINWGYEKIHPSAQQNENNDFPFFQMNSSPYLYYSVPWIKPGFFKDVVGLHFTTATRFETREDYYFANVFIQGQNPYLSEHLQYDFKNPE